MTTSSGYGHFWIYALIDPDSKRIFYVGRSKYPNSRLLQHMNEAEKYKTAKEMTLTDLLGITIRERPDASNTRKLRWLNSIAARGLSPDFEILDEWVCVDTSDANRLEDAWIAEMRRRGEPLTNKILSHRMNPSWYNTSPEQYINWLKDGKPLSSKSNEDAATITRKRFRKKKKSVKSNWGKSTAFTPKRT
jgi:hypothetical protein